MPNKSLTLTDGLNPKGQARMVVPHLVNKFLNPRFFKTDEDKMSIEQSNIYDKTSWMGTPVYDIFRIPAFTYTDDSGNEVKIGAAIDFDTVLLEVTQTKNIVTTSVQGRAGTVKEYISKGDYNVSISGVISSKYNNIAPFESDIAYMNSIKDALDANVAIPVACNFLDMFQINSLVVMDYTFGQNEGARNTISFSMNCISDEPFEIKYNDSSASQNRSVPSITF